MGTKARPSLAALSSNVPSPKRVPRRPSSCPPKPPTSNKYTAKRKSLKRASPALLSSARPTCSINECPPEILLAILKLAEAAHDDPLDQQRQRFAHAAVSKLWHRLTLTPGKETFAVAGFRKVRRLARMLSLEPERAAATWRLDVDIATEDRLGTKQMLADLLVRCQGLQQLAVSLKGRERYVQDAACLTVPLYDAFADQEDLVAFRLFFHRYWTSLTLGGDLTKVLTRLTQLKRLDLPRVLVAKGTTDFPFAPSLTHLSLHLFDDGTLQLLSHFIATSQETLLHLSLTVHEGTESCLLAQLTSMTLAPIAAQLRSFALVLPYSRTRTPPPSLALDPLLASLSRLSTLELCPTLVPDLSSALLHAPTVRVLTYHVYSEADVRVVTDFFGDEERVDETSLSEVTLVCWNVLSHIAARVGIEKGKLKACSERRGIVFLAYKGEEPTEEDDPEDDA